jgi:hypothetical protein
LRTSILPFEWLVGEQSEKRDDEPTRWRRHHRPLHLVVGVGGL